MSAEHKRPLYAFGVVSALCAFLVMSAFVRGDALSVAFHEPVPISRLTQAAPPAESPAEPAAAQQEREPKLPNELIVQPLAHSPAGKAGAVGTSDTLTSSDTEQSTVPPTRGQTDTRAPRKADGATAKVQSKADRAAAKAEREADRTAAKAQREADRAAAKAQREADKAAAKLQREADRAAAKAQREADKAAANAERQIERAAAKLLRTTDKAAAKAERKADKP